MIAMDFDLRSGGRIRPPVHILLLVPDECVRGYVRLDRPEPQRVHHRHRPRAHGEDVTQNSADARGCALKRLDERWVIVRLDLESAGPAVADVDDPGVLARPLQHALAARGQPLQVHARRFVGTMLAPHHAEYPKFGQRGLAVSQKLLDLFVLIGSKAVLPEGLRRKSRSHGGGHGETLLSHLARRLGRAILRRRQACERAPQQALGAKTGDLDGNLVFAFDQAARVMLRGYVTEPQIARQGAKKRNPFSNEHGHARDDEALNKAGAQKPLNRDPSVDVEVVSATRGKFRNNLRRRPGHLFHHPAAHGRQVKGTAAEHDYTLISIGPRRKSQHCLEGLAADDKRIDAGEKLVVAVGFAAVCRKKVKIAVRSRNETVNAGSDKDRCCHGWKNIKLAWGAQVERDRTSDYMLSTTYL